MMPRRHSLRFLAVLLGLSTLAEPAGAAGAKKAAPEPAGAAVELPACVIAYHASLKRIAAADMPSIAAATGSTPAATEEADPANASLPGAPLFVPPARKRSAAEMATLTAAVALARSKGRSTRITGAESGADRIWIAARLREDLGDYLNQKPTPFLCSGVPPYLETLRRFAGRLGTMGDGRPEWIATQRRASESSVKAAGEAIARARANAMQTVSQAELRPGAGLARSDAPAKPAEPALDSEAAILAAIDRTVGDAHAAGLVSEPPMPLVTGATVPLPLPPRPVLAKLAEARPLVASARPLIRDRNARLKVLAAFADLEMLDYLMKAPAEVPDPTAAAIGKVLDAIEAANRTDCTCGG